MSGVNKACVQCGKEFSRNPRLSQLQWDGQMYCSKRCAGLKRDISKDSNIVDMYKNGDSSKKIGDAHGMSDVNVRRVLRENGESIRRSDGGWRGGMAIDEFGYLRFTNAKANGVNAGRKLHSVIIEAMIRRGLRDDEVAHHVDGNKLNNHPDNLEVMTRSEHSLLHWRERKHG